MPVKSSSFWCFKETVILLLRSQTQGCVDRGHWMLCARHEYSSESMTVDAFPRSKPSEENSLDHAAKSDPPGMVVVPNLAMNNRPKLHIPNGYTSEKVTSRTNSTFSPTRIRVDPWSPSSVKLSFFFGSDPDPDPRGNLLDPRGYGLSQSVTDLRSGSISYERAVPVFVGKSRADNKHLSEDEEEYVTLDYNYVPNQNRLESRTVPGSHSDTGIKCEPWPVSKANHSPETKSEHGCNFHTDYKFGQWNNNHIFDRELKNQHRDSNPRQRNVSRTLRYSDSKYETMSLSENTHHMDISCDSSCVPRSKHYQDVMCDFRTAPRADHTQDIKCNNWGVPRTGNQSCVKSPRGSFNPGFLPRDSFESSVLHVRENTPPVYSRHMSMENGRQTVSQRREWKNSSLERVSESKVQTIATFTPIKNVTPSPGVLDQRHRKRSRSLPDLQIDIGGSSCNFSDDEDGDDFGFLSYPFLPSCFTTAAMQKAKSPSPGHKILPKRWRSKTKPLPNAVASSLWSREVSRRFVTIFILSSRRKTCVCVCVCFL